MIVLVYFEFHDWVKDYTPIIEIFKTSESWCNLNTGLWFLYTKFPPEYWIEKIQPYLSEKDSVIAVQITDNISGNIPELSAKWLDEMLQKIKERKFH